MTKSALITQLVQLLNPLKMEALKELLGLLQDALNGKPADEIAERAKKFAVLAAFKRSYRK